VPIRIAYLVNQYPKISHTFIRREIAALEKLGVEVARIALRGHETGSVDSSDASELKKTRYILKASLGEMIACVAGAFLRSPGRFCRELLSTFKLGRRSDGGAFRHIAYFVEACVLKSWLGKSRVNHVHAHFGTNAAVVAMLCKRLGGPTYSFTVHGPEEFDRPSRLALTEKVAEAEFVVAISSFCRSQLYRWARLSDWDKIQIVRCALDPEYFVTKASRPTDKPKLLCVGRLSEEKGQLLVVRATRRLVEQGIEVEVILAGDGPLRSQIENEIRVNHLEKVVQIAGWVDNERVKALLLESRALLIASFAEGLPVVIMEAFALGRPVISTFVAGIPELVENDSNGWLIPAGDVELLAQAMRDAVQADPVRLTAMGETGRQRTLERHNTSVEAAKLEELFSAIQARASAAGGSPGLPQ
jgi:glycosyltransferase involved in cell wall biosynthesis